MSSSVSRAIAAHRVTDQHRRQIDQPEQPAQPEHGLGHPRSDTCAVVGVPANAVSPKPCRSGTSTSASALSRHRAGATSRHELRELLAEPWHQDDHLGDPRQQIGIVEIAQP